MSDLFNTELAWLNGRMATIAATVMTVRRDGLYSATLNVTIGATKISVLTVLSAAVTDRDLTQPSPKHADHPFYFNANEYDFGDGVVEPDENLDIFERTVGGMTTYYRLSKTHAGEAAWAYIDGFEDGDSARIRANGRLKMTDPETE